MGNVIKGWKPASRFSGIAVRTLRKGVEDGALCGTKKDGIWSFVDSDLLTFAATIKNPASASRNVTATDTAISTPSAASAPAIFGPITADFLLAASSPHVDSGDEDEDENEDDVETHAPPFWVATQSPTYEDGFPIVDPSTRVIRYVSGSKAPDSHPPGTLGALVAELQQRLAVTQAQLAATHAAWRRERIAVIAAEIAIEALMSGTLPQVAMAARDAAKAAAAVLTDDDLRREDGYAVAIARGAGMAAAQQAGAALARAWQAQQVPWPSPPPRDPQDELSRARARRRSRSPRW